MFAQIDKIITAIDNAVWGLPLICLIMATGIFLTARLGLVHEIETPTGKDKGLIMKVLMPKVKGIADGKLVNQVLAGMMQ